MSHAHPPASHQGHTITPVYAHPILNPDNRKYFQNASQAHSLQLFLAMPEALTSTLSTTKREKKNPTVT